MDPAPPSRRLAGSLSALHRSHLARRGLELLSWALLLDVLLNLLAIGSKALLGRALPLPGVSLLLLLLLASGEAARSPLPTFAARVDRRFGLKERLRASLWYRSSPAVSADLREAQAAEVLRSVDFPLLRRELGPRVPPLLLVALPLFLVLIAFTLNTGFAPPGALTRLAVVTLELGGGRVNPAGGGGGDPLTSQDLPGEMPTLAFFSPQRTDRPADDQRDPSPSGESGMGGAGEEGVVEAEGEAPTGEVPAGIARAKVTESYPVSRAVSPPVPRVLTAEPSLLPMEAGGGRILDLFPLSSSPAGVVFGTGAAILPGVDLSLYPHRYRPQIAAYFKELMEWSRRP